MSVELVPVRGLPLVQPGDDLVQLIADACETSGVTLAAGDVLAITGKIVSKAEGRLVDLRSIEPSPRAERLATLTEKDPRLVELVLRESVDVVRARPGVLLVRHRLGWVSAAAGIDRSNVGGDDELALLLPADPDASAATLRDAFNERLGVDLAIVITDSHGRPFRIGNAGVAIGAAGLTTVRMLEGRPDLFDRPLSGASVVPTADLVASASLLVAGEADEAIPVVIVRGLVDPGDGPNTAAPLIRDPAMDMFAIADRDYG